MSKKDIISFVTDSIDGRAGIDVERLIREAKSEIVLDDVSIGELKEVYLQSRIVPILNSKGFYSVIRGSGKYISINCGNTTILKTMLENRGDDLNSTNGSYAKIQRLYNNAKKNCEGQMYMFGDGIEVEPTEADVMEIVDKIIDMRVG